MGKLVAYSGFSASNYLEQPYNADLDFGTGDFCVMGWVKFSAAGNDPIIHRTTSGNSGGILIQNVGGVVSTWLSNTTSFSLILQGGTLPLNSWSHVSVIRSGGVLYHYLDGSLADSTANTTDVTFASATTVVGLRQDGAAEVNTGSLALLRISATAPTASQIAKIHNDEKVLFQENAQATLYGSSDAVTALAHDDATDLLHVGTSAGRSVFQGLRRVSNTTTAVGTAISAANNLVVEE